jgi:hypothetical protein
MTKKLADDLEMNGTHDASAISDVADALVTRGRAVVDRVPAVADGARGALAGAQGQVDQLSDAGLVGALGFTAGLTGGLFLAGAPRIILALSAIPMALTLRAAMSRGVGPGRLVR